METVFVVLGMLGGLSAGYFWSRKSVLGLIFSIALIAMSWTGIFVL